jgi:short-chain fatty acids transporter
MGDGMAASNGDGREGTIIQRVGSRLSNRVERWMPSPFLFAILLTYIVFVGGVLIQGTGPVQMVQYWFDGFWILLQFTMQAVLVLVTGFVFAYHPFVQKQFTRLLSIPSTGRQATLLVGLLAMLIAWIHWGLGLIIGAILAREMGRQANERGLNVHYPLLCVAGFLGLALTWNMGLSGAAFLLMNTPDNFFIQQGIVNQLIPVSMTIFHPYTLTLLGLGIVYMLVLLYLLSPPDSDKEGITRFIPESELGESSTEDEPAAADGGETPQKSSVEETPDTPQADESTVPADRINNSRILGGIIALTGVGITIYAFATQGLNTLNLNTVNFAFLFIGFALFTNPEVYAEQFSEAVSASSDIILQFPFYAGIIGMMTSSGLAETLAESLVGFAGTATLPAFVVIIATVVNTFVPSGGGEWTVIGPIVIPAAKDLGVPIGQTLVSYTFGASLADLIQPFWALPLLGITDMRARDIFGYTIMMLILALPFFLIAVTVVPYANFWTSIIPF